jgi:hypothetical protein
MATRRHTCDMLIELHGNTTTHMRHIDLHADRIGGVLFSFQRKRYNHSSIGMYRSLESRADIRRDSNKKASQFWPIFKFCPLGGGLNISYLG